MIFKNLKYLKDYYILQEISQFGLTIFFSIFLAKFPVKYGYFRETTFNFY